MRTTHFSAERADELTVHFATHSICRTFEFDRRERTHGRADTALSGTTDELIRNADWAHPTLQRNTKLGAFGESASRTVQLRFLKWINHDGINYSLQYMDMSTRMLLTECCSSIHSIFVFIPFAKENRRIFFFFFWQRLNVLQENPKGSTFCPRKPRDPTFRCKRDRIQKPKSKAIF